MNKFVVWDKKNKRFLDGDEFAIDDNGKVYNWDSDSCLKPFKLNMELLNYIGKNDINNNKIYADCSIVKLGDDIGFIKYSPFLSANVFISLSYYKTEQPLMECSLFNINNMEIIDTIQENKLGLIKE